MVVVVVNGAVVVADGVVAVVVDGTAVVVVADGVVVVADGTAVVVVDGIRTVRCMVEVSCPFFFFLSTCLRVLVVRLLIYVQRP